MQNQAQILQRIGLGEAVPLQRLTSQGCEGDRRKRLLKRRVKTGAEEEEEALPPNKGP